MFVTLLSVAISCRIIIHAVSTAVPVASSCSSISPMTSIALGKGSVDQVKLLGRSVSLARGRLRPAPSVISCRKPGSASSFAREPQARSANDQ